MTLSLPDNANCCSNTTRSLLNWVVGRGFRRDWGGARAFANANANTNAGALSGVWDGHQW